MPDSQYDTSSEEFLANARKQFAADADDEKPIREQAELDLRFVAGDQWDAAVKNERTVKGRPALTFNRCHTFVQQVSNEARQNKPQIKFIPADDEDKDTAEIYEGLARQIQYSSDAQIAYETAVEYSAAGSFGYYRFLTDYCDDDSWDQELKICPVLDPFAVYGVLIPSCFGMEPDHAFVVEELPIDEYKRLYSDSKLAEEMKGGGWEQASKASQGWIGTETVRVAEYWFVEHSRKELKRKNKAGEEETRYVDHCTVKFCKINGYEVLEGTETEWPGYCIPIIPVLGKQIILEGKPLLFSVVRPQRDAQQLINFYKTRIAETLGTQPIQPYLTAEGSTAGHEREWAEMNTRQMPNVTYKAFDENGRQLPPPTRQVFEPPIAALTQAAAQEIDDMKATAGIFDASLGARSNENSGLAIQRRQQQSNITNMHFMDNLERAFQKGGKVLEDVIPKVYDSARMIQILGQDEAPKVVKINQQHTQNGKSYHYKIGGDGAAKYQVVVTMGKAFSTKKQESFDMMSQLVTARPELLDIVGDQLFSNADFAGADAMADRMKRFIQVKFPGLIENKENDPAQQLQQVQAQMQQQQQHLKAIDAFAAQLQKEKEGKVIEQQTKVQVAQMQEESRQAIVKMQEATKLAVAQINASKDAHEAIAQAEIQQYQILHDSAHDVAMQAQEHAHAQDMAAQQHQQALEQGQQSADNASAQSAQDAAQVSASPAANGSATEEQ